MIDRQDIITRLQHEVIDVLKCRFVGRDEVVDLIALALVAGEHLFLYGPPGTAKSALIRQFATAVRGRYFEYLLTRFSEPNEIFGPIDLVRLREGTVATVTTGMLPEAEFVFLDELFNANSAILNNLLTVLNERVYRRGAEAHSLPVLSLFSASNRLPDDDALRALFDRFLLRCHVDNLNRDAMPRLLAAGWALEQADRSESSVAAADLRELSRQIYQVDLSPVAAIYPEAVFKVRDLGIALSDRRAVKVLKLLAASALLCGRSQVLPSDLWVLRYVWDREEQIGPLGVVLNGSLEPRLKRICVLLYSYSGRTYVFSSAGPGRQGYAAGRRRACGRCAKWGVRSERFRTPQATVPAGTGAGVAGSSRHKSLSSKR